MRYRTPYPKGGAPPAPITPEDDEGEDEEEPRAPPQPTAPRRSPRLSSTGIEIPVRQNFANNFISPPSAGITTGALNKFMGNVFMDALKDRVAESEVNLDPEHVANGVVHPVTKETITKYKKLINDPLLRDTWLEAMCRELGRLAQGYGDVKGTDTVRFMSLDEIKNIPKDRVVTYARIVVDYRPQKEDKNRVRITAGGNLISYPFELTTRTADLTTSKLLWNSTISTKGAKYMCADAKNFYLATPLDRYEYMKMPVELIPPEFIELNNLSSKIKNGYLYMEIQKGMYGLPQSGILANKLLKERLAVHGYHEAEHTPGLFYHETRPIWFTLVVDDFGVKYVGKKHAEHLMSVLSEFYQMEEDWQGKLYCGITLDWNYEKGYVDTSMPNYVAKQLTRYRHKAPKRPQNCPYDPPPRVYGSKSQQVPKEEASPPISEEEKKYIQQVVGSFLYYARAIDMTILHALSAIAAEQAKPTARTLKRVRQFLDYMHTHPNAVIRFRSSDMVLNVHSDASYLTASRARSRAGGYFFLGSIPKNGKPIKLNGNVAITCAILKLVAASAAEAELGAIFLNAQEACIIRLTLMEMGHPQPPTPINIDNSTAVDIVNNTIKRQ